MSRALAWVLAGVAFAGCGRGSETKEVDEHRYELRLHTVDLPFALPLDGAALVVDGKKRGLINASTAVELTLAKGKWLADAELALLLRTTCGEQEVAMTFDRGKSVEESHRRISPDKVQNLSLKAKAGAPSFDKLVLLVDNEKGDKPGKVQVGKVTVDVGARAKARDLLSLGTCPEARKVTVNGKAMGEAFAPVKRRATLVDVVGGHCYRFENVVYAKSGGPGKTESYRSKPGQHLLDVRTAGYFLERAPDKVRTKQLAETRAELLRVPCR